MPPAIFRTQPPDKSPETPPVGPYLIVFGGDVGASEFPLRRRTITIGRSHNADLTLPSRSVSRVHARIVRSEDQFTLEDANSTSGIKVNGKPTERHVLGHGDSIEIGTYVLEFCAHRDPRNADVAAQAELLLRSKYRALPAGVRVRFRTLTAGPLASSASAVTLQAEQGGLLIPTAIPPGDEPSIELELEVPSGISKRFLAEVMGVTQDGGTYWMCVRLHRVSRRQHEVVVAGTKPGPWMDSGSP